MTPNSAREAELPHPLELLTESPLEPTPGRGCIYRSEARGGVADAGPSGRVRLDAIARWLQDVAYDDVVEAGVAGEGVWIARRTRIAVERFPVFHERLKISSWCSALGKFCAERRTSLAGEREAAVEAVTLWVHLAREGGVPRRLDDEFRRVFAPSAEGRLVNARLRHPPPPLGARGNRWGLRIADLDLAGHVNNSIYWQLLEEEVEPPRGRSEPLETEIEYRAPAFGGAVMVVREKPMRCVLSERDEIHASAFVKPVASVFQTT
jgi:acyl-ACP thioesterase